MHLAGASWSASSRALKADARHDAQKTEREVQKVGGKIEDKK
jgi:hypothetical protein